MTWASVVPMSFWTTNRPAECVAGATEASVVELKVSRAVHACHECGNTWTVFWSQFVDARSVKFLPGKLGGQGVQRLVQILDQPVQAVTKAAGDASYAFDGGAIDQIVLGVGETRQHRFETLGELVVGATRRNHRCGRRPHVLRYAGERHAGTRQTVVFSLSSCSPDDFVERRIVDPASDSLTRQRYRRLLGMIGLA